MANPRLKELRGPARRRFLKYAAAAGAAFALDRSKLLNVLLDEGGSALADTAACAETNKSVHLMFGRGCYAWMQLLWPLVDVAKAQNPSFAYHAPGQGFEHTLGDKPFYYGPEAPFIDLATQTVKRPMTAFLAGVPVTHETTPLGPVTIKGQGATGTSLLAAVASMQRSTPALLPVIGVSPVALGSAPGAPPIATVPSADSMVDLFNSAASRLILMAQEDKALFETYFKATISLREAAGRSTWAEQLEILKTASNLIGRNLAEQLRVKNEDLIFYGVPDMMAEASLGPSAKARLSNLARSFIVTKKAMALGLTNSVIIGVPPDGSTDSEFSDPHPAFDNMTRLQTTVKYFGQFMDRFYSDLETAPDPACTAENLSKTVIMTAHGDQPHSPLARSGWPDTTPGNFNWVYAMGNGYLGTGWYGHPKIDGTATAFDPTTGGDMAATAGSQIQCAHAASAAIAYAVAKGDLDAVKEFYDGPAITGIVKGAA
jgi:hypothetical protein